jgi:hypothetical protein
VEHKSQLKVEQVELLMREASAGYIRLQKKNDRTLIIFVYLYCGPNMAKFKPIDTIIINNIYTLLG